MSQFSGFIAEAGLAPCTVFWGRLWRSARVFEGDVLTSGDARVGKDQDSGVDPDPVSEGAAVAEGLMRG